MSDKELKKLCRRMSKNGSGFFTEETNKIVSEIRVLSIEHRKKVHLFLNMGVIPNNLRYSSCKECGIHYRFLESKGIYIKETVSRHTMCIKCFEEVSDPEVIMGYYFDEDGVLSENIYIFDNLMKESSFRLKIRELKIKQLL